MRPKLDGAEELRPDLKNAFRALSEADRGLEAGPAVEARLAAAFKRKHKRPIWPALLAIAATAILGIGVGYYRNARVVAPIANGVANSVVVTPPGMSTPKAERADTQVVSVASSTKPVRNHPSQPQEITTDFFPLVDFAPPADDGELVRVNLPATAMRDVGLPVREEQMADRVQADVVMSNGMATAIRFVKFSQ